MSRDVEFDPPGDPDDTLPTVVSEGVVKLGDISVRVLHLSDGQRVIDADDAQRLLSALFGGDQ